MYDLAEYSDFGAFSITPFPATGVRERFTSIIPFSRSRSAHYSPATSPRRLPQNKNQISLPVYLFESFLQYGFYDREADKVIKIESYEDLIGKNIEFGVTSMDDVTITGIIDTGFGFSNYR